MTVLRMPTLVPFSTGEMLADVQEGDEGGAGGAGG
jgi:hypothetical protein